MNTQAIDSDSRPRVILLAASLALAAGCSSEFSPVTGCEGGFGIDVDCQFQNPEDLALAPDGRILVSQFGDMEGARSGSLATYDPGSRALTVLFPAPGTAAEAAASEWGDPACGPPDAAVFSPHGIDIETRADGRHELAVVNHGGRESVELFEMFDDGSLAWRGCVIAPEEGFFNDVVLLRDGGFWATQMFPRDGMPLSLVQALLGSDTGWVYAWSPAGGFRKIDGTDAPMPNGIEKSADERYLYVNVYGSGGVRKIDVATGETVATADIDPVDNSTWGEDGRLLAAAHTGGMGEMLACQGLEEGSCGMPFEIVALDPDDLSQQVLIAHAGAPMGGVTVALQRDGVFYLGTFLGDRIGIVDLSD